ncbi:hypothetical protein U1Q18_027531 [Sarracenia purpurea var. burkii]
MFMQFPTYGQVMRAALVAEEELMDSRKVWNQKKGNVGGGVPRRNQKGWVNQKPYSQNSGQDSRRGFSSSTIVCFECNSPEHKRSECPRLTKGIGKKGNFHAQQPGQSSQGPVNRFQGKVGTSGKAAQPQQQKATGRVFALEGEDVEDPSTIEGMFVLYSS